MSKTLVIVLSQTREHELTFSNFKKNVVDVLGADLCLCIGVKPDYDYTNPFYLLAKYKFLYDEPISEDFAEAFEYAYQSLQIHRPKFEKLININVLHAKIHHPFEQTPQTTNYGIPKNIDNILEDTQDDAVVVHESIFYKEEWRNQVYGIKSCFNDNFISEYNITTYKKPLHWREFLNVHFHGWGVNSATTQHPASSGYLLFFRWFLLKKIHENNILSEYDRFIITRSDFIYQLPHPTMEIMDKRFIWIPDCEHYEGYTDRHVVLSKSNIEPYLNIFNNMVLRSNEYFMLLQKTSWNLERLIKFHLQRNRVDHLVREFPYIMYSVRSITGVSKWQMGTYSNELKYFIKYHSEYLKSSSYKELFNKSNLPIDRFYMNLLN